MYTKFNIDIPKSHYGHSLSVSDIVEVIDGNCVDSGFYFCDSAGYKRLSNFDSSLCPNNHIIQDEIDDLVKCDVITFDNAENFLGYIDGMNQL